MKFARLQLKAFGPFRERVIDLSREVGCNLHLIHGPNEAGKSSTLRAVTAFLFGIPERTADAFLHSYGELRIGATLILSDGEHLSAMRRKARKNSLFAFDEISGVEITDTPLAENTLDILMGGLDEALYKTLFGLDIDGLQQGSGELLRGEGEVGRSLFQAAAGLASLRSLMTGLDEQALGTFKARGSTAPLNRALQEFEEQRRILRDSTVKSSAWEKAEGELRRAEQTFGAQRAARTAAHADQQRLERLRINLPLIAERELAHAELAELATVTLLPADFRERRVAAEVELRGAEQARVAASLRIAELEAEAAALVVRDALLAQAAAIEQSYHGITVYRAAREALPLGVRRKNEIVARLGLLLNDMDVSVDLEVAAARLPSATLRARVLSLMEDDARLAERDQHFDRELPIRHSALERLAVRLASMPEAAPVDALERALNRVANIVDLESRSRAQAREERELESRLKDELTALWSGSLEELLATRVPLSATASDFDTEFAVLSQDERLLAEQDASLGRDLAERQRELGGLAAGGEVVTQTEVAAARDARDTQWGELRSVWLEGATPDMAPSARAQVFETAVREADRLADLLHADVERATRAADIRQRIEDMQAEGLRQAERRARFAQVRAQLAVRWQALIAPLRRTDLTPAALREWLAQHARIIERHADLTKLRVAREELDTDLARARQALVSALADYGLAAIEADESLGEALERARQAAQTARRASSEREALVEQLETRRAELAELEAQRAQLATRRADWLLHWQDAAVRLGLSGEALAAEARTRLDQFAQLATGLDELRQFDAVSAAQGVTTARFEVGVATIVQQVQEVSSDRPADLIAEHLYEALGVAREAQARAQRLASDIERERRACVEAERDAQKSNAVLGQLQVLAGGAAVAQLPLIEERSARRRTLEVRLADIDTQLVRHNARAVDAVLGEAEGQTLDRVESDLAAVVAGLDALEREVDIAQEAVFASRRVFDAIDGGPAAAEAQQTLRSLAARITGEARSYARLRLAHAVLGRVVQTYRERHQGPLLARAAEIFRRITLASFADLTVDYEDEHQVLLGVRPDEQRVPVAGMSQGTRDQLFLSLRLAAIEQHIASRGPLPVIVDDLLVQFDDDRALATLEVLTELATRTQVLFFTHHQHLVSLAQAAPFAREISVQRL